ncbi:uncharacterized protein G2W53_034938 [Senna tora]|uniref:Uncharacterized protein n=1 Tax=Senna tora TaxID=362788 RepID=A0A834SPA8_9FABA|nr:uncharacterized protein G2W53_034938 [Senna tora]
MTEVVTASPGSPRPTWMHPPMQQWLRASALIVIPILPRATVLCRSARPHR